MNNDDTNEYMSFKDIYNNENNDNNTLSDKYTIKIKEENKDNEQEKICDFKIKKLRIIKQTESKAENKEESKAESKAENKAENKEESKAENKEESKVDTVVSSVINKFLERAKIGKEKYGTNLDRTDLSLYDWIVHAQEEHMDAILYLEKIKKIIK